eukprot:Tbor_TRINITY_DN5950_c3_g1::TRINITY_DN5950_c3_g1_i1::g.19451::m.19451
MLGMRSHATLVVMKYEIGFRAILVGMWFLFAELTYPGVVVGTFGLLREGANTNIVFGVLGGVYLVLQGIGPGTSCVARLATVVFLLFVVGVVIAATRPFRYHINTLLYTITSNLLALYTALLAVTASRHYV